MKPTLFIPENPNEAQVKSVFLRVRELRPRWLRAGVYAHNGDWYHCFGNDNIKPTPFLTREAAEENAAEELGFL